MNDLYAILTEPGIVWSPVVPGIQVEKHYAENCEKHVRPFGTTLGKIRNWRGN